MNKKTKPIVLTVLDGWGYCAETNGNAIALARKPAYDELLRKFPNTLIHTSGPFVGLPEGQMGNSEVGHLNIGAGRIVYQDLTRISKSIRDGEFFHNETLLGAVRYAKTNKKKLHLFGLLSDGGVHSHIHHLFALLDLAKQEGLDQVYIHAFLDGRDVAPDSAKMYMEQLLQKIAEVGVGKMGTGQGRYYAMDGDKRWERTEKSYRAMVYGEGPRYTDPMAAILESYAKSEFDEFVIPSVIADSLNQPMGLVESEDA